MKRMAFVMAVVAMAGCSKGEKPAAADTSKMMMMSDTSHMMMSDTSKMMMVDTSKHVMMVDTSKKMMAPAPKKK
jgi:hypothetical protein